MSEQPELLAPAGDEACMRAAIQGGCNAVYFGMDVLNMRALGSQGIPLEDFPRLVALAHLAGVRCYLTLNTVLYDHELEQVRGIIEHAKAVGIHGIIVSDMAALLLCRDCHMSAHISTQLSVSNLDAVKFFSAYADRIVLARELNLEQIKAIASAISKQNITGPSGRLVEIELFAHGAMCVAVSGRCGMSLYLHNRSANRGECLQPCRRKYRVTDMVTNTELVVDNHYVMSPKDLNTLPILDQITTSGVSVLKIEGRTRSPEYVYWVTRAYRQALNALSDGTFSPGLVQTLEKDLNKIYHRGYAQGFYLGLTADQWSGKYGSHATHRKIYCGKVLNYFAKAHVVLTKLEASAIVKGDELVIIGPTTGVVTFRLASLRKGDMDVDHASPGDEVTFTVPEKIRPNDRVHVIQRAEKTAS